MDRARRGVVVVVQGWAGGAPAQGQAPPTAMLMMRLNGFDESYGARVQLQAETTPTVRLPHTLPPSGRSRCGSHAVSDRHA